MLVSLHNYVFFLLLPQTFLNTTFTKLLIPESSVKVVLSLSLSGIFFKVEGDAPVFFAPGFCVCVF